MDKQMAYVMCERPTTIDMQAVIGAIRARHPSLSVEIEATSDHQADEASLIRLDGERLVIAHVSMPLPYQEDEWVWARAEKTWPDARAVASGHRAHIVVAMAGEARSALHGARLVTVAVGALLEVTAGCRGVVWGAELARSAQLWRDASHTALAAYPAYPILLWVDVVPVATPSGAEIVTVGLASFVGREIEHPVGQLDMAHVLDNVAALACYLIEHGEVIKDGDTIGDGAAERIVVRHAMSANFSGLPVLRIAPA